MSNEINDMVNKNTDKDADNNKAADRAEGANFAIREHSHENRKREFHEIDYKDARNLYRYVSEKGKIIPSRVSNLPIKRQREIAKAIKRARIIAIMPFVSDR
ncbi:MAG: 30S ribosomal protein S18 [Holosporales bacterium]|jgi:small subunit ribosomal protein S18|nr:30S ribosomal protein S18 [Holosporales bacterium]